MTWSFKPGDKVVCVDDDEDSYVLPGHVYRRGLELKRGEVYTIRDGCFQHPNYPGNTIVRLVEIKREPMSEVFRDEGAFCALRFRPVQTKKADISIFTDMLTSSKVDS